jgi:hypothetical protein
LHYSFIWCIALQAPLTVSGLAKVGIFTANVMQNTNFNEYDQEYVGAKRTDATHRTWWGAQQKAASKTS